MTFDTKPSSPTIPRSTFICAVVLVSALSCAITLLLAANTLRSECQMQVRSNRELQLPHNRPELTDRLHSNGVTALKAYGADKCFILTGDTEAAHSTQRVLTVIGRAMSEDQMASLYGEDIATFCDGRDGYVVRLQEDHHARIARQTRSGPSTDSGGRFSNGCQNSNIVDCGSKSAVYKCNTGPAEIYHGELTCNSDNEFTFRLVKRCDKFKNTQKLRFIKCLQYFLQGPEKTGEQIEED